MFCNYRNKSNFKDIKTEKVILYYYINCNYIFDQNKCGFAELKKETVIYQTLILLLIFLLLLTAPLYTIPDKYS